MRAPCDYLGMQRPPTTTNDANDASMVARYDVALARDIERRERDALVAQRERDARRADYDASMNAMPITMALRTMRAMARAANTTTPNAFPRRRPPIHTPTRGPLGDAKRGPVPNAWETCAPHMRTHLAADKTCHHPLVVCHHKW